MTCYVCENGIFELGKVDKPFTRDGKVILFTGVPAEVCDNCGEVLFSPTVAGVTFRAASEFFDDTKETAIVSYETLDKVTA